ALLLLPVHLSTDLVWYGLVSFLVGSGRALLSKKARKIVNIVCGVILLGLGVFFLVVGLSSLS
ncbi:lysine transporter LysE, partial [Candidatus Geothermarchaeota archaeon]